MTGFFPPVSFKARTVVELHEVRLCSTNLAILLREWLLAHWEWRDGGNSVYPRGMGLECGVLYSRVARTRSCLEDPRVG